MSAIDELLDLEDRARLELTLKTREIIINDMMFEGKVPEDKNGREFLIKALDGLDRTILTKAKIKSDDTATQSQRDTTKLIADVLSRLNIGGNTTVRTLPSSLPNDIKISNIVEGEVDIGVKNFTYDEFMTK